MATAATRFGIFSTEVCTSGHTTFALPSTSSIYRVLLNAASQAVLVGWPQPSEPTDLRSGERLAGLEEAAIVVPVGLLPVKKW
jgi:hypothetical protein